MNWVKTTGRLMYDPVRPGIRKQSRNTPWWLVAEVDPGVADFYRWLLKRYKGLVLDHTAWRPHVTILDGREEVASEFRHLWKKREGLYVPLEYNVDVEKVWKFWTLPVRCEAFGDIREELGFKREYPFHITFGREKGED